MSFREFLHRPLSRRILGLLGAAVALNISRASASVAKPNLVCTKLGQSVVYRGRKFTCIRVRGKLVWNDGVPLPIPSSTAPSSMPTKTMSASPSPNNSLSQVPTRIENTSPTPSPTMREFLFAKSSDIPNNRTTIINGIDPYKRPLSVAFTRSNGVLISSLEASCTHAGCIVIPEGRELRCPCHGSRFDYLSGDILDKSQQALTPLREIKHEEREGSIFLTL